MCVQGSRRSSVGGGEPHPLLALICSQSLRTPKVMYACIKGIPIVKEAWLLACFTAHKLLPFGDEVKGSSGHQAFQGLRLHLAGSPGWLQSFGRLIQHAGTHLRPPFFAFPVVLELE